MNLQRLYEYRFRGIDQAVRASVWSEIAPFVHRWMGSPRRVLDPAAGRCEFINAVPAQERWAVDQADYAEADAAPGVRTMVADIMEADLPGGHFDGVWVSNTLEHLLSQEQTAAFLERMHRAMAPGGRIAIMGPNFRYCAREYFDCADHTLVYTHVSIAEHLYAAGFEPERIVPRFLPYSFRGRLPAGARPTRLYLRTPALWRVLGKQFLVIGRKPAEGPGGYGERWSPDDEEHARRLIFNTADPESFERAGREDAERLSRYFGPDDVVLDLGCGIGRVARYVAPLAKSLWAVDASPAMLVHLERRLADQANVHTARCEDIRIPGLDDGSVDFAYALLVLQHLEREDAFALLTDLRRIVRTGGRVYLTFPNLLSDPYLESFLAYVRTGEVRNPVRARLYTPQEVERILPAAGFCVESIDPGVEIVVVAVASGEPRL